ncbi:beta-1,3-glucan-binding protein-like isoform X2 [Ptychodera flava]|uniref:beta-1,3-glucan-binding protein-like isoform X2 n=1 Tax=Ptychodera flava TaxID=63121 RepID=UPI00396A8F7C
MPEETTMIAIVALLFSTAVSGYNVKEPTFSILSPQGLRMAYPGDSGVSLVAFHYSINTFLSGVTAGQYNVDVTSPTNGEWVHENTAISLKSGDTVYYWVLVIHNGLGYQNTELKWTVPSEVKTTKAPPSLLTTLKPAPPVTDDFIATVPAVKTTSSPGGGGSDPGNGGGNGGGSGGTVSCDAYPCQSSCDMTIPPCNGLIFEDTFDDLDFTKWEHEITAGGGGNWEFQLYHNNRSNSYVRDGVLYIKPTLTADHYGDSFLTSGRLDLWGSSPADMCTGNKDWGCERSGSASNILNPIESARLRTVNTFSFKHGRVEVEAKMPTGDWIWPAIWLLPKYNAYGGWPASGEIDIVEVRGNEQLYDSSGNSVGIDQMGSTMHWGPYWPLNGYERTHTTRYASTGTFGSEFHKYGLTWTEDSMTFYLDDQEILHVDPGKNGFWEYGNFHKDAPNADNPWQGATKLAPFDQEFYIIMNVAVGGTNYFSDDFTNLPYSKPWSNQSPTAALDFWNARNQWYPTWNGEDAALQVNYVRVWAN